MIDPATRDAAARALLALPRAVPAPGSLAHLMPDDDRARVERARLAAERRAERRAATLLPDLERELIGQLDALPRGHSAASVERFIRWSRRHTTSTEEERRESIEAAAELNPTCEVEWQLALACAGAGAAEGFDLEAHVKRTAAAIRRARLIRSPRD